MNHFLRVTRALLFTAILCLIAACGDDGVEVASGQPGDDDSQSQESAQEPDDGDGTERTDTSGYQRVEPRSELLSAAPAIIDDVVLAADGSTVLVRYMNAAEPCSGARVTLMETDSTVQVLLETGLDLNAAAMSCIAQVLAYEIAVPLATPLEGRELVAVEPGPTEPEEDNPFEGAEFPTDQYLGLTEIEAMQLGEVEQRVVRIARIDDEFFTLTEDFSPTRVSVEIEAGIVVVATSG